jgi:long-subunit acyl-CoA synthetase (AMP-forming)
MLYLLLTCSGSEGRPKAVMLSHTNHVVQALEKIAQVRDNKTCYLNPKP